MSVLFTDTMTVYNYYRDQETEKEYWIRSVVRGVQWSHNKKEITVSGGVMAENRVESLTIDFQHNYDNKPYIDPVEFSKLPKEEAENYWTLNGRSGQDIAVLGVSEKDISREYRLQDLINDFYYSGTITSVTDNRNRSRLKNIKAVVK